MKSIYAIATLIGTIVGMGIFGIPYVAAKAGFWMAAGYLFLLGAAVLLVHLMFGEILLRNRENHRLVGFAAKYFGNLGRRLIFFTTIFGIYGALIIYIIAGGKFLEIIFSSALNWPIWIYGFLLWLFLAAPIFKGLKTVAWMELLMVVLFVSIIGIIVFVGFPRIDFNNLSGFHPAFLFLPYGVMLFAVAGGAAIPEIRDILRTQEKKLAKSIIWGTLIPVVLYFVFMAVVVGVTGSNTSPEAIEGLVKFLDGKIILLGAIFGVLAGSASFLVLGMYLKDTFRYDFKINKNIASILVVSVPLLGVILGMKSFILIMGLVGVVLGGIEDVVLIRIYQKSKKIFDRQPEYNLKIPAFVLYFIMAMFIGGIIWQVIDFI